MINYIGKKHIFVTLDLLSEHDTLAEPVPAKQATAGPTPAVRRSERDRGAWFPVYYGCRVYLSQAESTTIKQMQSTPDKTHWLDVNYYGKQDEVSPRE